MLQLNLSELRNDFHEHPYDLAFVACREDTDTLTVARNLAQQTGRMRRGIIAGLRPSTSCCGFLSTSSRSPACSYTTSWRSAVAPRSCSTAGSTRSPVGLTRRIWPASWWPGELWDRPLRSCRGKSYPGGLRQANRAQADHIPIKRWTLVISDSAATVEMLAVAEH